ncbi:MAG TPA: ATP-binding protein [Desulfomicrobiaceae bacterium]|nr:ATP-binding protein [Desulfomicrobiaceae bacterium]
MSEARPYSKEPAFVNRTREMVRLQSWIDSRPEGILFLYGPKSSGKTTLLNRFVDLHLRSRAYDLKHFNLREILLVNYESFLNAFFERKSSEQVKETRQYDLKVFKLSVETLKGLESRELDPFVVMKRELEKQVKKGRRPVIIIDELQALEEVYFNGQRELLKEMFNFFVAMTKESHLCHVIIASSDGFFIERISQDSKLKKTSRLMEVEYIGHEDVMDWLSNLDRYSRIDQYVLETAQQEAIWAMFGGSCWEISDFLGELLSRADKGRIHDEDLQELLNARLVMSRSLFAEYATIIPQKQLLLREIARAVEDGPAFVPEDLIGLVEQGVWSGEELLQELVELVRRNFLSYAPPRAEYILQGRSMELGLEAYVRALERRQGVQVKGSSQVGKRE